jgi:hypothetical protein
MTTEAYFELRFADGTTETLDGLPDEKSARAVTKAVAGRTNEPVRLFRVREIDLDAKPRTRS